MMTELEKLALVHGPLDKLEAHLGPEKVKAIKSHVVGTHTVEHQWPCSAQAYDEITSGGDQMQDRYLPWSPYENHTHESFVYALQDAYRIVLRLIVMHIL